jgi:hypothetical protein
MWDSVAIGVALLDHNVDFSSNRSVFVGSYYLDWAHNVAVTLVTSGLW